MKKIVVMGSTMLCLCLFVVSVGFGADCSAVSPDGRNEIRLGTDPLT